jgi:hypothetical protein
VSESFEQPPVHQLATFDQGYAELNAWVDKLINSYRELRAENTSPRELDIAGLAGWAKETQTTRGDFAELLTVAVVRLAEDTETDRLKGIIRNRDHEITELRALLPPDEHGYQIPGDDD